MRNSKRGREPENWKHEFAEIFNDSWDYVKEQKRFIYAVALIFFASAILGFAYAENLIFLDDLIKEIIEKTSDLDYIEMIWFIFSNNVTSSLFALFLGLFFGIFPLFNSLFNGTLLGYVYSKAIVFEGYFVIWRLFPHGIFELPAVFISLGLGLHLGVALFGKNKRETIIERSKKSLRVFLSVIVPLLILAALIESTFIFFVG